MGDRKKRSARGLPIGPVLLILAGVLLLLNNMGALQEGFLGSLWQFWPVLVLLLGLNEVYRKQVFGAVFWLGAGSVYLLANLGWLESSPGFTLLRLWPVLVVAVGLEIIFGRKSIWMAALGVLAGLVFLAGGLWYVESQALEGRAGSQAFEQPLGDFDQARIFLDPPVASLEVRALSDSGNLVEGSYTTLVEAPYTTDFALEDGTGIFSLTSEKRDFTIGFWDGNPLEWLIGLNTAVVHDLDVNLGVGDMDLDLAGLALSGLDISSGVALTRIVLAEGDYRARIEAGVGRTVITLPESGNLDLDIELGVGEVVIRVPEGMAVRVRAERGLTGFQTPTGFLGRDNVYSSPGFNDAENQADITISVGVGNIAVR